MDAFFEIVNATYTELDVIEEKCNPYADFGLWHIAHTAYAWGFKQGYVGGVILELVLVGKLTEGLGQALGITGGSTQLSSG